MKIYIADKTKITKYNLPLKVDGSFLFPYRTMGNRIENLINIEAVDGKWYIKNNGNVNINAQNYYEMVIPDFSIVPLTMLGSSDFYFLFSLPSNDSLAKRYSFYGLTSIIIGSNPSCNICYQCNMVLPTHAEIRLVNNEWQLIAGSEPQCLVYLNDMRVTNPCVLKTGDVIFINGLKIIWMNSFIKVNNPNDSVLFSGLSFYNDISVVDNSKYTPVTEEESNLALYNEDDYFSHTPRIYTVIEEKEVQIDAPPENQNKNEELPFILSIGSSITMLGSSFMTGYNVFYSINTGRKTWEESISAIMMLVTMIIGSLLIPRITASYQKKRRKEREELRQKKYRNYLQVKEREIELILKNQAQTIHDNNVDLLECKKIIEQQNRSMWNREIKDSDFLSVRLGIGNQKAKLTIKAPEEHFSLDDDDLQKMVYSLSEKYKFLEGVPITVSFKENKIFAFLMECSYERYFIDAIMLQLITFHSALDLKIVVLTNNGSKERFEYVKFLPHAFSEDRQLRFFATNTEEINTVCSYLDKIYSERHAKKASEEEENNEGAEEKKDEEKYYPYYLIVTDSFKDIKNNKFVESFLSDSKNYGFSFVLFERNMKNLPKECEKFAGIYEKVCGIFDKELKSENQMQFLADYNMEINMSSLARRVSNVPIQSKEEAMQLPNSISFLEMYKIGKIEQLNITNRWISNNPTVSIQAPVGVHKNGDLFKLDLHEKKDGPHGLIAGSTGSGKSEFIITYILSMAINYHPYEVQFVLIDYKGGGLAGAFENRETGVSIPHLAGTITNLDVSEMNRTLVSIESELKRRQAKFNEVRDNLGESTMDIYKYQRLYREGMIKEPISHLFIISDEFAELKSQQPEFMNQLISTARIGRSLGVHLILATQKPSGVVNDQIWSNSKFKVCLKVQSRADSMEMLKRPEAASIKETGRFYLQVGYDEYFDIGQSAWAGASYVPSERIIRKTDNSVNFIDNVGNVVKTVNDAVKKEENKKELGDQLTNIVRYLNNIAVKENLITKKLWLPPLKDFISLKDVEEKYGKINYQYVINPTIGEYDAPKKQSQGLLSLNLSHDGNTLIYGVPGSGKENLISSIVYSIAINHSPDEINIYIADFGAETLKIFQKMPMVGDVFVAEEKDKLVNLIQMVEKEFERRKKLFIDFGGDYEEYLKLSGNKEPLMLIIINSYEVFTETYPKMGEAFTTLFRDGSKYGIVFIVSASVTNALRSRVTQNFPNKICLQMPNPNDYRDLLGSQRGMVPPAKFGRGIASIGEICNEFQTASISSRENMNQVIRETVQTLSTKYPNKAKRIPVLPKVCYVDDITFELKGLDVLPIGIEINSLEVYVYDFTMNKINLISAQSISNHIYFLYALIRQFLMLQNVKVKIVDVLGLYKGNYANVEVCSNDFDSGILRISEELRSENANPYTTIYLMIGIGELKSKLQDSNKKIFEDIFENSSKYEKSIFIFADDYTSLKKISVDSWYRSNVDNTFGIWLGEEVGTQMAVSVMTLTVDDKKIMFPYIGYPIYKGNHMIVKYAVDGVEREDEE